MQRPLEIRAGLVSAHDQSAVKIALKWMSIPAEVSATMFQPSRTMCGNGFEPAFAEARRICKTILEHAPLQAWAVAVVPTILRVQDQYHETSVVQVSARDTDWIVTTAESFSIGIKLPGDRIKKALSKGGALDVESFLAAALPEFEGDLHAITRAMTGGQVLRNDALARAVEAALSQVLHSRR